MTWAPTSDVKIKSVPAIRPTDECDCFFHNRVFMHLWNGVSDGGAPESGHRMPLAYDRYRFGHQKEPLESDQGDFLVCIWFLCAPLPDGMTAVIKRKQYVKPMPGTTGLGAPMTGGRRLFTAHLTDRNQDHVADLELRNPQALTRDAPTLIWLMPNKAGQLILWDQAWWYDPDNDPWDGSGAARRLGHAPFPGNPNDLLGPAIQAAIKREMEGR